MPTLWRIPFLASLLTACSPQTENPARSEYRDKAKTSVALFKAPAAMPAPRQKSANEPLPEPGEVLRAIYKKAGNGSSNYSIGDGIWVSYWYGHSYYFNGRRYFTGFAYSTDVESRGVDGYPAPGDQVSLSQATYALAPEGSVTVWEFIGAERGIGRFGGRARGDDVDDRLSPQTYTTPGDDYLLTVPTWYLASGVRMATTQIFRLKSPGPNWEYLGSIATGEDNTAACAQAPDDGLPPCRISQGELTFRQWPDRDMPSILVAIKAKAIAATGKAKKLSAFDSREYFFDRKEKQYR